MTYLTFLKFAGILVSGVLGILGTATETRDKVTGKLTTWGRWALWFTIGGLMLALGAQLGESIKERNDEIESAKRTEEMLAKLEAQGLASGRILDGVEKATGLTAKTVNGIERILTPLNDHLAVDAIYELPPNDMLPTENISIGTLRDYFDTYLSSGAPVGRDYAIAAQDLTNSRFQPKDAATPQTKIYVVRLQRFLGEVPDDVAHWRIRRVLESLENPTINLNFNYAKETPDYKIPILRVSSYNMPPAAEVIMYYAVPSKRLFVHWHCDFKKDDWMSGGQIVSLRDVAGVPCDIACGWTEGYPDRIRPIIVGIQFDRYWSFAIDDFMENKQSFMWESSTPKINEILEGRASPLALPDSLIQKLSNP